MTLSPLSIRPPLKWAGGKRWLTGNHPSLFPPTFRKYYEPFVGGAAVFFHLRPSSAHLSDRNSDLINMYKALKADWRAVQLALAQHAVSHSNDYYYSTRRNKPADTVGLAAWFLYMNRSCYNGLYRVNQKGDFNVPKGTKDRIVFPYDNFESISRILSSTEISHSDFEISINMAGENDFVYLDPPYTVRHNNNGFLKYNEVMFSWADQERLAASVRRAASRKAKLLVSNAAHSSVLELYADIGETVTLDRYSVIGGGIQYRSKTNEIAVKIGY